MKDKFSPIDQFDKLFAPTETPKPSPQLTDIDPEKKYKPKKILTRREADILIDLVEAGREITNTHPKYEDHHRKLWDEYWEGIGHSLKVFKNPRVTSKMLMWCYMSITRSMGTSASPKWLWQMIQELKRQEKELNDD